MLAIGAKVEPIRLISSLCTSASCARVSPLCLTYSARASIINFGVLTNEGHSRAHILQLTHRSATCLNSLVRKISAGSLPISQLRIKLTLPRGEAEGMGKQGFVQHRECECGALVCQRREHFAASTCEKNQFLYAFHLPLSFTEPGDPEFRFC